MDTNGLTDKWLRDLENKSHKLVGERSDGLHKRVKIAFLDTGIDGSLDVFQNAWTSIKGIKSWVSPLMEQEPTGCIRRSVLNQCYDDDGHGTHLAALILRVAPWACLYIARIADSQGPKQYLVAEAIRHASEIWGVDIISLSLGFPFFDEAIHKSIITAVDDHSVLIFASASNEGANTNSLPYPARDGRVICINSAHYNGAKSGDNPRPEGGKNLAILGENVSSAWPRGCSPADGIQAASSRKSGCSVATAIAASTGALLLELLRQDLDDTAMKWAASKIKTLPGINLVLKDMAKSLDEFQYIEPFTYLDGSQNDATLGSRSRRSGAQTRIFNKLREEYNYQDLSLQSGMFNKLREENNHQSYSWFSEIPSTRALHFSNHLVETTEEREGNYEFAPTVHCSVPREVSGAPPFVYPPLEGIYYCTTCNTKLGAFDIHNQIRRHLKNKHEVTLRLWICKDNSPDHKLLSQCKSCREEHAYIAYDYAAVHLKCTHFKPGEKDRLPRVWRGHADGDGPPMEVLRLWMEEIDVPVG